MFFIFKCAVDTTEAREELIYKRNYSGNSIETFKQKLRKVNWNETRSPGTTSVCFSAVTVNDDYRKSGFKIKRRG